MRREFQVQNKAFIMRIRFMIPAGVYSDLSAEISSPRHLSAA